MHDDSDTVSIILIDFIQYSKENNYLIILCNNLKKKLQSPRSRYSTKKIETFDDLPIHIDLLRGIYSYGYEKPSKIQMKCLLPIITSEPPIDCIVKSKGGTGKTSSYSISIIQRLDFNLNLPNGCPQAIVIVPSRELAWGVSKVIETLGQFLNVKVMTLVGGENTMKSINELKTSSVHVVVGTSGRILDYIKRRVLNVKFLKILIMEEADELIERGFIQQIENIVTCCTKINLQICLFGYLGDLDKIYECYGKLLRNPELIQD